MLSGIASVPGGMVRHGETVATPVRVAIPARYPDDHAMSFDRGDLRGAQGVAVTDDGTTP